MLQAVLEAVSTLGPIVLLMLIPVLIPVVTLSIATVTERVKSDGR
jgi:hypothetical protein